MTEKKETGQGSNPVPVIGKCLCGGSLPEIEIYSQGVRVRGSATFKGGRPPDRKAGDIKGWSASSRRNMREFLLVNSVPTGWKTYSLTLTVPALPVGSASPCIDRDGACYLWKRFSDWLQKKGHVAVWRLEIQPRTSTKREDIRGIEQPHWHLIAAAPPLCGIGFSAACDFWLSLLGDRGKVYGASDRCAVGEWCEGWSEAQTRYLFDHASKAKALQVANGWGRHWGVVNRKKFVKENPEIVRLGSIEKRVKFWRIMRKIHSRRVPDRRAVGGIPWQVVQAKEEKAGTRLYWMGDTWLCRGWWGWPSLPPLSDRLVICSKMGKAKKNIWAMRKRNSKRGLAGQWFGSAGSRQALEWVNRS